VNFTSMLPSARVASRSRSASNPRARV
jgi:hypothetical protein